MPSSSFFGETNPIPEVSATLLAACQTYATNAAASAVAAAASEAAAAAEVGLAALKANNLSDLADAPTARTNLGLATVAASGSASDLTTGTLPAAQLPNPAAATLGGVKSLAAVANKFLTSIGTDGLPVAAQPAAADVSGLAASATTDTTNATNISSGTLATARLPALSGGDVTSSAGSGSLAIGAAKVTQAMLATGVAGTGPAFSAYQSGAQSVTQNTFTKINLQTEEYDTANCFDNATNYRFTPNVAGYYLFTGAVYWNAVVGKVLVSIYKNGAEAKRGTQVAMATDNAYETTVSGTIYMNGSTDYVELYTWQNTLGTATTSNVATGTFFQGTLIRAN